MNRRHRRDRRRPAAGESTPTVRAVAFGVRQTLMLLVVVALPVPGVAVGGGKQADPFATHPARVTDCERVPPTRPADPAIRYFDAAIEEARARQPNFAGCWRVIEAGCGTACQQLILVHPSTGATRWGPTISAGADYRRHSEWLVTNARDTSTPAPRRTYRFDTASAVLLPIDPVEAPAKALYLPPPVDETPRVADLRRRMQRIIDRRDHEALLGLLDPEVLVSFGGNGGPDEFREYWALDDAPEQSPVWDLLDRLLRLPPSAEVGDDRLQRVVWPYYFDDWPEDKPAYGHVFAADYAVPIRARPSMDAPPVTRVSFAALATADASAPDGWTELRIGDGERGFVAWEQPVFPVLGHRMLLHRENDQWRIGALVAGD